MLVISIPSIDLCLHKKMRKTSMVEPFSWLWWLTAEHRFIAFMTGKMFWLQKYLQIDRFGAGFQWSKSSSIFWRESQRIFDQFSLSLFSTRTFLTEELAILKSEIFWTQLDLFGFLSLQLQNLFQNCKWKKTDDPIVESCIEIDRLEAEKCEFTHESCTFSISFFQPYI